MEKYFFFKAISFFLIITLSSCIISSYDNPCSISGKISNSGNEGISDVRITSKSISFKDSITSSIDGKYKIDFTSGGTVNLLFTKAGFTSKTSDFVLLGGEKKVLNIKLNTLSEDSYFTVRLKEKTISNIGESYTAGIYTNVDYEFESKASWVTCLKSGSELLIKCESNETTDERNAIVILKAEFNHRDTLRIKQLAGPVLRILDYIGKSTSFPQTKPFVTFSREVNVVSATSSNTALQFELSNDKKTVFFNNIKMNAFSSMPIQIKVVASDGIELTHNFDLRLFINSQSIPPNNGQTMFFTNNNQQVLVFTINGSVRSLRRFSCTDFKEQTPFNLGESSYVFYNPYNNSIYSVSYRFFEDRYVSDIRIYDAETVAFTSTITIDNNRNTISSMAFSESGFGLMVVGDKLYYIDSSDNHKWGLFTSSSIIYDPHQTNWILTRNIEMCNNNKNFVLYGGDSSGTMFVYNVNSETKTISQIYSSSALHYVTTSNLGANILYYSEYTNSIIFQNVIDKSTKTLTLPFNGFRNSALLLANSFRPTILTSDLSLISFNDNTIKNFTHQGECYYIKSSNDGKLVLINYNGIGYLFKSEIFTTYFDFIK